MLAITVAGIEGLKARLSGEAPPGDDAVGEAA